MKLSITLLSVLIGLNLFAQQVTADFENLTLNTNEKWDGIDTPLGATFSSGDCEFLNYYDTAYGGYWASGWAYTNIGDDTTAGFTNLFGNITGLDQSGSGNYAVGQQNARVRLTGSSQGKLVSGLYITNTTYAYLSMRDGDAIAKKFGGATGDDPDFFKIVIRNFHNGALSGDSVEFFLADFRDSDNSKDYIVNSWEWLDLTSLGLTDSLVFTMVSSDVGMWGINTPLFFSIDGLVTNVQPWSVGKQTASAYDVWPNPASDRINTTLNQFNYSISDIHGKLIESGQSNRSVNISNIEQGIYFLNINNEITKFVKF